MTEAAPNATDEANVQSVVDAPSKVKVIKPLTKQKLEKHLAAAENRGARATCRQRARGRPPACAHAAVPV